MGEGATQTPGSRRHSMRPLRRRRPRSAASARPSAPARALRQLFQQSLHRLVHRVFDGRCEVVAGGDARPRSRRRRSAQAVVPAPAPARSPRRSRACASRRPTASRERIVGGVKAVHGPRPRAGFDRVDHEDRASAIPRLDEGHGLALQLPHLDVFRRPLTKPARASPSPAASSLPGIPDSEDECQARSTSSWRKCVAHEIQGSWLRIRLLAAQPELIVGEIGIALLREPPEVSARSRWFWEVGSTILASRIVPSSSSS